MIISADRDPMSPPPPPPPRALPRSAPPLGRSWAAPVASGWAISSRAQHTEEQMHSFACTSGRENSLRSMHRERFSKAQGRWGLALFARVGSAFSIQGRLDRQSHVWETVRVEASVSMFCTQQHSLSTTVRCCSMPGCQRAACASHFCRHCDGSFTAHHSTAMSYTLQKPFRARDPSPVCIYHWQFLLNLLCASN